MALTAALYADGRDLCGEYVLSSDTAEGRLDSLLLLHYARANVAANEDRTGFGFGFYLPVGDSTMYTASLRLMPTDDSVQPGQGAGYASLPEPLDRGPGDRQGRRSPSR